MNNSKYKISFCTVCMNRLHHLKETLPKNIHDNIDYGNIEFVLLNYNSKDNLDDWVKSEMVEYIESGLLVYYKTTEPENFKMSHSKNVVSRCATGDVICNIDADNFTGKGFADYVNKMFIKDSNVFLTTYINLATRDCCGRICLKKEDFYNSSGYDENMESYGFEDLDLKNRLQMLSVKKVNIEESSFLKAIHHDDKERLENDKSFLEFEGVFFKHISYSSSIVLFLFKNSKYFIGRVIINRLINSESIDNLFVENRQHEHEYSILGDHWETGKWNNNNNNLCLNETPKIIHEIKQKDYIKYSSDEHVKINGVEFIKMEDEEDILIFTMFYSQITNRNRMEDNQKNNYIVVNKNSYGKANLIKNFSGSIKLV
ncbi:MAG: glycosyltransferase family A protein [Algibacter sp.]